jgi:GNAT superfamily N-acetyltransferase
MEIEKFQGQEIEPVIEQAATIFMEIFREYPYLYGGDLKFELEYLQNYLKEPNSAMFIAYDGETAVGASTCIPLEAEDEQFYKPIVDAGYNINEILYLGESAVYPAYRGMGLGVQFFKLRENHAHQLSTRDKTLFCRVLREHNHPAQPRDYQPLDQFWRKRGYYPLDLYTSYPWQDIGDNHQTHKVMGYWIKQLDNNNE